MIYAGIGSRETPASVLAAMVQLGRTMAECGHTLRSGACSGADQAFEAGCDIAQGDKQIFLPWRGYEGRTGTEFGVIPRPTYAALDHAAKHHPAWERCSQGARRLHARNSHIILGEMLNTPAHFVICWSRGSGGTEQGIRIAHSHRIPVYNLYTATVDVILTHIRELE